MPRNKKINCEHDDHGWCLKNGGTCVGEHECKNSKHAAKSKSKPEKVRQPRIRLEVQ